MPPYIVSSKIIPPLVLPIFSLTVFFIGAMEFMLSPMLNPLAEAFKTTTEKATWLVSGYAFAYACTAPIFGWLSDRINRRKLLLISLFFLSFDGLALTIAPNLEIAIGLRLTELCHWRLPFWVNAAGCLLLFFLILNKQGISRPANAGMKKEKTSISFQWIRQGNLLRPLLAKGCWNGTAVSAFILSGEILRQHYGLGTGVIGISVSAFGIGLGLGNLAVSMLKRLSVNKERALLWAIVFILLTSSAFISISFSLFFSLACLMLWGCALGFAAPVSTSILTERAENNKGQILAVSESLNNLTILLLIPTATLLLARYGTAVTMVMLGSCLMIGIGLTIRDLNR
ncbi:MFS transporter [Xenorhabdus szentirmaii]|uniref:Major facilitator superfamily (MFS) profile domain-containing protein n=1 Tax=Xenorhabdus szentirmaii DSM 16338 TaxID=1427518 RepID=W1IPW6_9GAMM|nr:MFS transporter [Xenorhabdus szentirmaii]PHM32608.1 chloramphenicol/florfenicol exporter [Xenorhabdus szentirmaii DSM 16338]PHM41084.1 chloramphenicol/florfenicol exporter [Xenorhabdus szentirmaii]CDL80527.1 conserved membrane hypothetical protein [Xenorhabdus szentirmaii DSM 16338]